MVETLVGEIKILVRLPPDLHALLKELAERDVRSLNSEMVYLLRRAAEQEDQPRRGSARQG
jgi:hypothetical protein